MRIVTGQIGLRLAARATDTGGCPPDRDEGVDARACRLLALRSGR
jgi:hypothetical protein